MMQFAFLFLAGSTFPPILLPLLGTWLYVVLKRRQSRRLHSTILADRAAAQSYERELRRRMSACR